MRLVNTSAVYKSVAFLRLICYNYIEVIDVTDVGKRIKQRRQEIGISADVLAEKIGVSRATMFRYENGSIDGINVKKLVPIAKALRTTPEYLMGWDEAKEPTPRQRLIDFAESIPEDKADQMLRIMKAILASDAE